MKIVFITTILLMFVSCGASSNISSETADASASSDKIKVKRVFSGETYILNEYDKTMYSSLSEFVRLRCSMPAKGVSSVNAGSSGRLYIVDGNQGSGVPLQMIYSIKIVDPAFNGSYGFNATGVVIEIETMSHYESRKQMEEKRKNNPHTSR